MTAALLAAVALPGGMSLSGGARAYFESGYVSSSGNVSYATPVSEQYYDWKLRHPEYGYLSGGLWVISDVTGQNHEVHDGAFNTWEFTFNYGYEWALDENREWIIDANAGVLWDFLRGYYDPPDPKVPWCARWAVFLRNPYVTPYVNFLGGCRDYRMTWARITFGLQKDIRITDTITLTPFTQTTWLNAERIETRWDEVPDDRILGGVFGHARLGAVATWRFYGSWYLWGRYYHYFLTDPEIRRYVHDRHRITDKLQHPFFGLGVGVRF